MLLSGNSFIMSIKPKDYILVCINRPGYFGSDLIRLPTTTKKSKKNRNTNNNNKNTNRITSAKPQPTRTTVRNQDDEDHNNNNNLNHGNDEKMEESSDNHHYCYKAFAHDVEQLANHLQVDSFFVVGHSSGGPCALACASYLPSRVRGIGILSGDPEYAHDGVPDKKRMNIVFLKYVLPFVFKYVLFGLPFARNTRNGLVNDYQLETSMYPFRTEHIRQPTLVYVGKDDKVMPLEVSRHVHERLDHSKLHIVPEIGHLGLLRDHVLQEFFEELLALVPTTKTTIENNNQHSYSDPQCQQQQYDSSMDTTNNYIT